VEVGARRGWVGVSATLQQRNSSVSRVFARFCLGGRWVLLVHERLNLAYNFKLKVFQDHYNDETQLKVCRRWCPKF
jgi:hypothetical protein